MRAAAQTITLETGSATALFLDEDTADVSIRWSSGDRNAQLRFSDVVELHVFDKRTRSIVLRLTIEPADSEVLPGWAAVAALEGVM